MTEPARRHSRPSTDAEAAALSSEVRLRILRLTYFEPLTNKEIAGQLGKDPATTLHHVRKLVDTGFLEPQPVRRGKRGSREIPYKATGLSWELSNEDKPGVGTAMVQAFLGEIAGVDFGQMDQTRMAVQVNKEHKEELFRRFAQVCAEFADTPVDPGGERIGLYFALYPLGNRSGNVSVTWDDDLSTTTDER